MNKNSKELIINSIKRKEVSHIPMMYRADPSVNKKLINYFNLDSIEKDWEKLIEILGADNFSDGATLGAFTTYFPKYIGPDFKSVYEPNHFFIWGIKPIKIDVAGTTDIVFHKNPPLCGLDEVGEVLNYQYPKIEWFDFNNYKVIVDAIYQEFDEQEELRPMDLKKSDKYILNAYYINSIFITSIFMRGIEKMLMDLVYNKKYSQALIGKIGEYMVEFCKRNLEAIGKSIDLYAIWDDFATQNGLMISPETWREFYKPWDKKIIEIAKKYNLLVSFHVCGSCIEIIPDLIEMGVDILDPVQVSAKNMELSNLKKLFGKDICFHGGLDAQRLIPRGNPEQIKKEVKKAKELFSGSGGIILGPSHYITADTSIENILAIYKH